MAVALNDFSWVSLSSIGTEKLSHVPMIVCFALFCVSKPPSAAPHLLSFITENMHHRTSNKEVETTAE